MTPLAALVAALLAGAAPFKAEQPRVKEGNEKLLSGDPAAALQRYGEAEREAGPRPEIEFDRGDALYAQGKHAEAREAWRRAVEADRAGTLSSRALQNMGNALDAAGDHDGAARAFADALGRDPGNEDARYNLEVLLRRKAAEQEKPKDQGNPKDQAKPKDGQGQQPKETQQPEGAPGQEPKDGSRQRKPDQGQDERRRAGDEERREQGQQGAAGEREPGREGDPAGARGEELDRQDAEQLLDALRARERNMPLGPAGRKDQGRRDVARDW